MPITRTPIVDDSGSGQDGTVLDNAWKQEFYNQIDALSSGNLIQGTWTPVDASGAGLVLTNYGARYTRVGSFVSITGLIAYPATANTANAQIGGLPYAASVFSGGLYSTYGIANIWHLPIATTAMLVFSPTAVTNRRNVDLSGAVLGFSGVYYAG